MVPEIPRLPIGCPPRRTGTKQTLLAVSISGLVTRQDGLEAVGVQKRYHWAGAIYLLFIRDEERRRSHLKSIHNLRGDAIDQFHRIARLEQALAERIQLLDVMLAGGGVRGLPPCA